MTPQTTTFTTEGSQKVAVVRLLNRALANESILLIRTHKCRWDTAGAADPALHRLFEAQSFETADHVERMAERIRALGGYPASTAHEFMLFAKIKERPGPIQNVWEAVQTLVADHETIARSLRELVNQASEILHDAVTADQFRHLLHSHEGACSALRPFLRAELPRPAKKTSVLA